jgi:RNA polymerase sigma-70 factor (ECF subfamily)
MTANASTTRLYHLLGLLQSDHPHARNLLVEATWGRCRILIRRMFPHTSWLHRRDETDDVLQKAMLRLYRALEHVKPSDVTSLLGLLARQIRWVLRDLVREAARAKPVAYVGDVREDSSPADPAGEPQSQMQWADFHSAVEAMPDDEREMFDLLFYQVLSQADAAALLGTSVRTVKRRWQQARLLLHDALRGDWPDT